MTTTSSSADEMMKKGIRPKRISKQELNEKMGEIKSSKKLDEQKSRKKDKGYTVEKKVRIVAFNLIVAVYLNSFYLHQGLLEVIGHSLLGYLYFSFIRSEGT